MFGKSKSDREEIKKLRETERLFREALKTGGQNYIADEFENSMREGMTEVDNDGETRYNKRHSNELLNILTGEEKSLFYQGISELDSQNYHKHKLPNGNYLLDVGNKLIETNGDYDAPSIESIIEFHQFSSQKSKARDYINEKVNNGTAVWKSVELINRICEEEVARYHGRSYSGQNQASYGQGLDYGQNRGTSQNGNNGTGVSRQTRGNKRRIISYHVNEDGSTETVYSDGTKVVENKKYSRKADSSTAEKKRLTDSDIEDYLHAGERGNISKIRAYESGEKVILTSESEIKEYIGNAINGEQLSVVSYGKVSDRLANDVEKYSESKIDISDNYLELVPNDIRHAYKEHKTAKEQGNIDLTIDDFENIPEYFDSYDELVYAIKYNSGRTHICVSKKLPEGRIIIIETVSKSRGAVQFKNAIGLTEDRYIRDYQNKYKRDSSNSRGGESLTISPRDDTISNNSISPDEQNVNNFEQKGAKKSRKADDTVTVSKGKWAKMRADYLGERVFTRKSVQGELEKISAFQKLPAKMRNELIDSIWQGYNNRLNEHGFNLFSQMMFNKLHATILQETSFLTEALDTEPINAEKQLDAEIETASLNQKFDYGITQNDVDRYVDNAYQKENTLDYQKYAMPSDKLLSDTKDEIDLSGYIHAMRDNDIRHIRNSHGDKTNEKYPVTAEDIKHIPDIVFNYDKVFVVKRNDQNKSKTGIIYVKVNADNTVYFLEQVTEQYHNEKLLVNKQMIKTGITDIPHLKGLEDAILKKQSKTEYLADLRKIHEVYAQSATQPYSTYSVSQNQKNVKFTEAEYIKKLDAEIETALKSIVENAPLSARAKMEAKLLTEDAAYWKKQAEQANERAICVKNCMQALKKLQDSKSGKYRNASKLKNEAFKRPLEQLARINFREGINVTGTRGIFAELSKWYTPENELFADMAEGYKGRFDQEIKDMLDRLADEKFEKIKRADLICSFALRHHITDKYSVSFGWVINRYMRNCTD